VGTGALDRLLAEHLAGKRGPRARPSVRLARGADTFVVSNDGRQVAFLKGCGCGHGDDSLALVSTTGGRVRLLPKPADASDDAPALSPNGQKIAFLRTRYDKATDRTFGPFSLLVESTAGGEARRLLGGLHQFVKWSPDGRWIAYCRGFFGCNALFIVKPVGGPSRLLARIAGPSQLTFSWAPNSKRLALGSASGTFGDSSLGTVDLQGHRQLFALGSLHYAWIAPEEGPRWSPNGARIAFSAFPDGHPFQHRIYVIDADGRGLHRLA
jgi:Tol biopolymer transport system component